MSVPFDSRGLVARYVHGNACGIPHPFDSTDCVVAAEQADRLIGELRRAGIGLVPLEAVGWLERAFGELIDKHPTPEQATDAPWYFEALHHGQVRVRRHMRDGSIVRGELVPHYMAVIELTALNSEHGEDVASAVIEDEADWIKAVTGDRPDRRPD